MADSKPFDQAHGQPLVSIGVPVYNGEKYIQRALDSLLAQDYDNLELIISDNASDDATVKICEDYARKDKRVSLFENPQNMGTLYNFGRLLELAHGDFFMWAGHDDYRDSNYISALLEAISASDDFGLSCPRVLQVAAEDNIKSVQSFPERDTQALNVIGRSRVLIASVQAAWVYGLYRTALLRPVFRKVFQTGLAWGADHLIILSFLLNQSMTGTNRTTLYQWRTRTALQRSKQLYKPKSVRENVAFGTTFVSQALKILLASRLTPAQKLCLLPFLGLYMETQVFRLHRGPVRFSQRIVRRLHLALEKISI